MEITLSSDWKDLWQAEWEQLQEPDVYFSPDYFNLYKDLGDGSPTLYMYQEPSGDKLFYPFLKRRINDLPQFRVLLSEEWFDITTPYGYGGPLYTTTSKAFIHRARYAFEKYCQKERIVSEFIRFSPLLKNHCHLEDSLRVEHNRKTVYIDLTKSEEELLQTYHPSHKRNLLKAQKNGLTYRVLTGREASNEIDVFMVLYYKTMDRRNASNYYYFPRSYFHDLLKTLSTSTALAIVYSEEKAIAAALFFGEGNYLHYHLGCSDSDYFHMAPNNLLFHETSLWGGKQGFNYLHLGGGYSSHDSLFHFKKRFNPAGTLDFYIGKKIHHADCYEKLTELSMIANRKEINKDYFPVYRG